MLRIRFKPMLHICSVLLCVGNRMNPSAVCDLWTLNRFLFPFELFAFDVRRKHAFRVASAE